MGDSIVMMMRRSPFSSVRVHEALRSCVGLSMGDAPLKVVFVEDGVYTVSSKVKPIIEGFDWNKHLEMLQELEFDIIVEKQAAADRGITEFNYEPKLMSAAEIADVLKDAHAVITY